MHGHVLENRPRLVSMVGVILEEASNTFSDLENQQLCSDASEGFAGQRQACLIHDGHSASRYIVSVLDFVSG